MHFIAKAINSFFKMLVYTWIFICITCARTAAEKRPTFSKLHKDINLKHDRSTIQTMALKARNKSNKLTFQTLYPQFMSTWSSLKLHEKQRQFSQVTVKKEERRQYLSTKKVTGLDKPTTIKRNSMHNAFIEVETMRPYVPKRNTTSKKISKRRLNELRHKITRSRLSTIQQFIPNKQIRKFSAPVSTAHKFVSHLNIKQASSPDLLKDLIKRKRILTAVPTSYPLQKLNSVKPKRPQKRNNNSTLLTNGKQVLTRLERLESDLKKIKRVVKNDTEVINYLQREVLEKEDKLPDLMIRKKNSSSTVTPSVENAKSEKKNLKSIDNIKARTNPYGNSKQNSIKNNTKSEDMHDHNKVRKNKDKKVNQSIEETRKNDKNENKQDINKVNQLRMEWLKKKLSGGPNQAVNYRRKYKNFDDINNRDEEKEYNYSIDEFSWVRNKKSNIMTNKRIDINKRKDIRNIDQITKDPLDYDSFDVRLQHESNIQEFIRLKNENAIPTYKPYAKEKSTIKSTTANKEVETNFPLYDDNSRRDSLLFAPPPGFNETNLELTKNNNNDQEVFDDVLKKIINVPSVTSKKDKKAFEIDDTETLGRKMFERLDLPGLKIDDTIPNNDFYKFDHVKYVESVMRRTSLPLYERRNIAMKSLDKRLNELYKEHNLKPKQFTVDDLDNVLKSMGATIHK